MLVETRRDGDVVWGVRNVLLAVKVVVVDWRGVVVIIILDDLVEEFFAARFLGYCCCCGGSVMMMTLFDCY